MPNAAATVLPWNRLPSVSEQMTRSRISRSAASKTVSRNGPACTATTRPSSVRVTRSGDGCGMPGSCWSSMAGKPTASRSQSASFSTLSRRQFPSSQGGSPRRHGRTGPARRGLRELGRTLDCGGCGLRRSRHRLPRGNPQVRPKVQSAITGGLVVEGLAGRARFEWDSLDAWFEEDEQVFVHARDPYTRVDALRSTRSVRVELEGVVLAESSSPVMVFETGLPTRYYLNRTEVDFTHLAPTNTLTACPYKGTTSGYWTAHLGDTSYSDIAWTYDFPTRQLLPIAGLIAFYNEKVDTFLDGRLLDRPVNLPSR